MAVIDTQDNGPQGSQETRVFAPSAEFVKQANISGMEQYNAMCAEAEHDYEGFWAKLARENLTWQKPFTKTLNEDNAPFYKWFEDGLLNVSYNCLDVNLQNGNADKTAIIFEADDGQSTNVSYKELHEKVCKLANGLKSLGIKKGDRVIIYMSMSVEGVAAMQACARIGATHSIVFGGFSAKSLQERIIDAGAVAVITGDQQLRGGKKLPLKSIVDEALALGDCACVKNVIVYKRTGSDLPMTAGRDLWLHDLVAEQSSECEPEWVDA
ncbi:MAG: acetyl-CoA synthetase, partial [Janthinobacterium sp.]